MNRTRTGRILVGTLTLLALAACGGGSASVGGTLSGLGSGLSVALQNDNTDTLSLTANGEFTFATDLASAATYNVTVLTQPVGQTCNVSNGSGTIDINGTAVSNVVVACSTNSSVGGTVTGLAAGTSVTLANAGALLAIASASRCSSTSAKRGATSTRSQKPITFIARAAAPTLPGWLVPIRMKRVGSGATGMTGA